MILRIKHSLVPTLTSSDRRDSNSEAVHIFSFHRIPFATYFRTRSTLASQRDERGRE